MDLDVLDVPMTLVTQDIKIKGRVLNPGKAAAFLINHSAETALMKLRYLQSDIKILAAEKSFSVEKKKFNAGTLILPIEGNPASLLDKIRNAVEELGLTAYGVASLPKVQTHELAVPRIAILHTWLFTQNEGWYRLTFDRLGLPYDYICLQDIRDTANLKSKYDVIIFPPVMFGTAQRLVNGIAGDDPIPWAASEKYPNPGGPDSRDDIRGGMEMQGVSNLMRFIKEGGLFIPITTNASLPIDYGMVENVAVVEPEKLKTAGAVLQARITDLTSPVSYGYGRTLGVHFSGTPVFETGMKAATGGLDIEAMLSGESSGRASGRGSLKDPDVIQGRPHKPPKITGAGTGIPAEYRDMFNLFMPPDMSEIRVILRFEQKEKLLISGMLGGSEDLQNRAAVVDVPLGQGHILFFAVNPMWRFENHGSFFLLFNAALNYNHLDAGRPKVSTEAENEKN